MLPLVDLGAPGQRCLVGTGQVRPAAGRDDQVSLGVAHQSLDHALRLRIRRLAEVGTEAEMGGEAHVLGVRHDDVGDGARPQASHAVRKHHRRDAA